MSLPAQPSLPEFAVRLLAEPDRNRLDALAAEHVDYSSNKDHWELMIDAFEGTGGFAKGGYLWPYRNERKEDFEKRQEMARYHNYVEAVIDLYVQHVFTILPDRQTDNEELRAWWDDVDGNGTPLTDFMRKTVALALAAGHTGILMDKTTEPPKGLSKAEEVARPFLARYLAPAITDWRTKGTEILGVKLRESVPDGSLIEQAPQGDEGMQFLLWDMEGWARFNHKGELITGDVPGLGAVPFSVIRPKPSILRPFIGRSLFSHGKIIQAIYNRMSEEDEVTRNQAFSLLTVKVNEGGDVEQAKKQVGENVGTQIALVLNGEASYISPDMKIPAEVRENISFLIREVYRIAHMRYVRDSLQAESAEAIRLQFKELNEMLQGLAAELQRVEHELAWFYFLWTSPTPEAAQVAYDAANVAITYPDEFFVDDLITDLTGWAQAIAMDLGDTMEKRLKKKAARRIFPDLPPDEAEKIDAEIEAQPKAQQQTLAGGAQQLKDGATQRLDSLIQQHVTQVQSAGA